MYKIIIYICRMNFLNARNIIVLVFLLSLLTLSITCNQLKFWKDKAETERSNHLAMEQMYLNADSSFAVRLQYEQDEFNTRYKHLADSLGLKVGRIKEITKIKIRSKHDTLVLWRDSLISGDTVYVGKTIRIDEDCFGLMIFEPKDSNFVQVKSEMKLDGYVVIHKGKRINEAKLFGWTLFRYGKRKIETDGYINCKKSKFQIQNIQVID